jgi:hypothetical protein
MAWVTPAAFVANETLTAAKMNQLVDAVEFLNGLSAGPTPAFPIVTSSDNTLVISEYMARHRSRYLHAVTLRGDANRFVIKINGVQKHSGVPVTGTVDTVLDMNAYGLVSGEFYTITIELRAEPGDNISLLYLSELASSGSIV